MNPLSNEFRLCNSDGWRSGNHGGRVIICGYGVSPWNKEVFGSSDHKILTNPSSSLLISMILIDQVCEDMKFPRVLRVLILEVEDRLLLFEEEIDNGLGIEGNGMFLQPALQYFSSGLSKLVIICSLSRETLVDYCCQSSPSLMHVIHKHVGVLVKWTFVSKLNKKSKIPELQHKDFRDIYRDSESLKARGVLDKINDHLKCLFLL
ncbi:hypothetical protein Tco_0952771 [Tanacetum coccineum]|uniref:Uncharacterized protein n=1 Tax=Tanacetum coccineum TaxID=301880 RepID=A0ABQ5E0U6_9ASTR